MKCIHIFFLLLISYQIAYSQNPYNQPRQPTQYQYVDPYDTDFMEKMILRKIQSANTVSCQKIYSTVTQLFDAKDYVSCIGSSVLTKVEYYLMDGVGFAIVYVKQNNYDIYGKPYIFCGVPLNNWNVFKIDGVSSWGESYHKYIRDYKCNCS